MCDCGWCVPRRCLLRMIYLVSSSPSELLRMVLYCEFRVRNIRRKLPTAKIVRRWRWKIPWYNASLKTHRERERERVRWKNNGFEKQCRWKWCGKCWNYLRALRSSTTSTCDVIDDWWLMVDRVPLAVRPPANAYKSKLNSDNQIILHRKWIS